MKTSFNLTHSENTHNFGETGNFHFYAWVISTPMTLTLNREEWCGVGGGESSHIMTSLWSITAPRDSRKGWPLFEVEALFCMTTCGVWRRQEGIHSLQIRFSITALWKDLF